MRRLFGWRYISSLHSADEVLEGEAAVHCCDPASSVLVVLVSRNVFHVVSGLQSIAFIHILFWLIRSLIDRTFAVFIVWGPLQLVTHFRIVSLNC